MRLQHQPDRRAENFPVASLLLPKKARHSIMIFYDYVRGLDNIADAPDLSPEAKQMQLRAIAGAVASQQLSDQPLWVARYLTAVASGQIDPCHGEALMQAFWQDTHQTQYENWEALLNYCRYSAVPVGRFVLDQMRESSADLPAADALCSLLQLLNHLQDLHEDYAAHQRVYLPMDWMQQKGMTAPMLAASAMTPQAQQVYQRMLEQCEHLLRQARPLPASIKSLRLRIELRWIIALAARLLKQLQLSDPLAHKVTLSRAEMLKAFASAISGASL